MPDDRAPRTKYLRPASVERLRSRLMAASTYRHRLCSSRPRYRARKSLAEIIISMPSVASTISTGYSNRSRPVLRRNWTDMGMISAEPSSTSVFMKRAKASVTNMPLKVVAACGVAHKARKASTIKATARREASSIDPFWRNTPTISSTMLPTARISSGNAGIRSGTSAVMAAPPRSPVPVRARPARFQPPPPAGPRPPGAGSGGCPPTPQ